MSKKKPDGKTWIVPDCFLPAESTGKLKGHESTCVLNVGKRAAEINFTAYFEDREPIKGLTATCPPNRTVHIRVNSLKNKKGQTIPLGVPFALKVESDRQIVVQHTRLDSTQPALALMTTMAFPVR